MGTLVSTTTPAPSPPWSDTRPQLRGKGVNGSVAPSLPTKGGTGSPVPSRVPHVLLPVLTPDGNPALYQTKSPLPSRHTQCHVHLERGLKVSRSVYDRSGCRDFHRNPTESLYNHTQKCRSGKTAQVLYQCDSIHQSRHWSVQLNHLNHSFYDRFLPPYRFWAYRHRTRPQFSSLSLHPVHTYTRLRTKGGFLIVDGDGSGPQDGGLGDGNRRDPSVPSPSSTDVGPTAYGLGSPGDTQPPTTGTPVQ